MKGWEIFVLKLSQEGREWFKLLLASFKLLLAAFTAGAFAGWHAPQPFWVKKKQTQNKV